jgi:MoxR-like ATPase
MADDDLLSKVHSLSDLELAFLLSLIAREHCQIRTRYSADIPDLLVELRLLSNKIFGLQPAVIHCTPQTTLDDFTSSLLLPTTSSPVSTSRSISPFTIRAPQPSQQNHEPNASTSYFRSSSLAPQSPQQQTPSIAPILLASNLDQAPKAVQIQALELLRSRRIFTRTSVHTAPKTFLFVAVISDDGLGEMNRWLNDWFHLAHRHDPEGDGYPNLEEEEEEEPEEGDGEETEEETSIAAFRRDSETSTASSSSVVKQPGYALRQPSYTTANTTSFQPVITESDISLLAHQTSQVQLSIDVARYQMNIVSFLRMHRAVGGGITPTATKHFEGLVKSLAPLHGFDYVTPSLVQLAARKVYLHRIQIVKPEMERSMQWGSELAAVEAVLEGVGPEEVVEDVLGMVAVPL